MKRIITLLMAAVMVLGAASLAAAAVEFKTSGHMHLNFSVLDNKTWDKDVAEDNFFAAQRFRPKLTMKADGVTAVFEAQQHQAIWGSDFPVNHSTSMNISLRQAYVDFKLPGTPVSLKVGYQQLNLPGIWRSPVFESRVGAVVASVPFNDQIALSAFWARPAFNASLDSSHNSTDMFGALLPLNFGNVKVTPYLVYARIGMGATAPATNGDTDALFVGGAHVAIMPTDALSIKVDAIATSKSSDFTGTDPMPANPTANDLTRDTGLGFMLAAAVDYKMSWGTPGAFIWYASGPDDKDEGSFISVATDGFAPSTWGFKGSNVWGYDSQINSTGVSTAAIGVQVAGLSFVDGLKHTARLLYAIGTADEDTNVASAWTTKDSFIEANFDSNWSIYENLAAVLELGAIFPDIDGDDMPNDPALKAQLTLRFSF